MQKVSVGVTSAAGYGVTVASVIAAALDYIGGDHSQPTKTTLLLGVVAGVSFVTTQVGRYAQAHAQAKVAPAMTEQARYEADRVYYQSQSELAQAHAPDVGGQDSCAKSIWEATPARVFYGEDAVKKVGVDAEPGTVPSDLEGEPVDDQSDQGPAHEQKGLSSGLQGVI